MVRKRLRKIQFDGKTIKKNPIGKHLPCYTKDIPWYKDERIFMPGIEEQIINAMGLRPGGHVKITIEKRQRMPRKSQ